MSIHFPDWVSPALALARQTLESCHAPDSFDFVGQIDETLPREGYRMQLSPMESGKQTLRLSGGSDVGLMYGAIDFVNRIIQRLHTPSLNVRRSLRQMRVHAALCFQFLHSQFFRIHVLLTP